MTLTNTPTVPKNSAFLGGTSSSFAPVDANDKVSFTITVVDPCKTTTVNAIVITGAGSAGSYTISVTDGNTGTFTFVRPTTTVETDTGIASVCGATSYTIHKDNAGGTFTFNAAWAVITGPDSTGKYTLTIDTNKDLTLIANEASMTYNLFIKAKLDDYTADTREVYTSVAVVINSATCDCSPLAWDDPSSAGVDQTATSIMVSATATEKTMAMPAANTSAKNTQPAFEKCYLNGGSCSLDGQVSSI